jgi:hypothetical protein
MSILKNTNRYGNFTSSEIFKLISRDKSGKGFGAPALTYIEERNLEFKLSRSLDTDVYTRDMAWGIFLERRVYELLPFGYALQSDITNSHPTIPFWRGSADLTFEDLKIAEIKCYQPKKFAKYTDAIMAGDLQKFKEEFVQEYWQLVSNAIINKVPNAEAISYMPYKSDLHLIREMADLYDEPDNWKYRFIAEGEDNTLAFLPNGGYYKDLNRFEFEVPQEDIELLTYRVQQAGEMLIKNKVAFKAA